MSLSRWAALSLGILLAMAGQATEFDRHFCDSTLRLDYIMAGDINSSHIFLDGMSVDNGWWGRRQNLDVMPLAGNGSLAVTDPGTGNVLYYTTFSTLYNEWLATDEALTTPRSFQNVFLVPFPRHTVDVRVTLTDARHDTLTSMVHRVDPSDIMIAGSGAKPLTQPHRYIHRGGDSHSTIDVAILSEGYTAEQTGQFYTDATNAVNAMFGHEPFGSLRDKFNFVAVAAPSANSGVSVPKNSDWKHTVLNSHYSTFYSDRYLTTPNLKLMHDALTGIPYEHIIVLVNSDEYGGGGIYNLYTLTTARHSLFDKVVVHEFGHSFGGLADEYFYDNDVMTDSYPVDIEPWEPNVTTSTSNPKWKSMLRSDTPIPTPVEEAAKWQVGVYEGGAYSAHGVYRPADHCRMRDNETEGFCPVCCEAIRLLVQFYTEGN